MGKVHTRRESESVRLRLSQAADRIKDAAWQMLDARSLLIFGLILVCVSGLPADPPKSSCNQPRCEDRRGAVPEFAFNPLDPMRAYHQHPAFRRFIVQSAAFDPRYILEAFGVRVNYHYDCTVIKNDIFASVDAVLHERAKVGLREYDALAYRKVVPSRSLACLQHEARLRQAPEDRPRCVQGFFPPVDDEYIEYADALQSVIEHDPSLPYVVVELGARYGTWAVRCVKALQQIRPGAEYVAYMVENEEHSAETCRRHCRHNDVLCSVVLASVGMGNDELPISTILWDIAPEVIDYLDLDIQGYELGALQEPGLMELLGKRVRRIHVGTHSNRIHAIVKRLFTQHGWVGTIDYHGGLEPSSVVEGCHKNQSDTPITGDDTVGWDSLQTNPDCLQMTAFGPVYVRDGMLSFANPALFAGAPAKSGGAAAEEMPLDTKQSGGVLGLAGQHEASTPFRKECAWPDRLHGCQKNATHWILSKEGQGVLALQLSGVENDSAET